MSIYTAHEFNMNPQTYGLECHFPPWNGHTYGLKSPNWLQIQPQS